MLLSFQYTAEGLRDEVALERLGTRRAARRRASGDGEGVDKLEDEKSRECAAKVADTIEGG